MVPETAFGFRYLVPPGIFSHQDFTWLCPMEPISSLLLHKALSACPGQQRVHAPLSDLPLRLSHSLSKYLLSTCDLPPLTVLRAGEIEVNKIDSDFCLWGVTDNKQNREINALEDGKCYGENKTRGGREDRKCQEVGSFAGFSRVARESLRWWHLYRDLKEVRVGAMRKIWGQNFPGRGKSKSIPGCLRHYKGCCGYSDVEGKWYPTSPAKEESKAHIKPIHSSPNTFVHFKHIFEALLCSRTCYCRAWKSSRRYDRSGLCSYGAQILVGK